MKKICVYRLSAMGDVIMMVQAVRNVLNHNPEVEITVVTKPSFIVFFGTHPRLQFHKVDLKGKHKGFWGLLKLGNEIKKQNFDFFLDLHDVLRSKIIRNTLLLSKTKIFKIDKARKEKEAIILKKTPLKPLKHSVERYADVFKLANCVYKKNEVFHLKLHNPSLFKKSKKTIGIAPFAAHESKTWGTEPISELICKITQHFDCTILLFGGGKEEVEKLNQLSKPFDNVQNMAGKFSLEEEMSIMSSCDIFIAMDSSNMHLADLLGLKVFSLWFSTHPFLGFGPWNNEENCIQPSLEELPCRPVSVYGKLTSQKQMDCTEKAKKLLSPQLILDTLAPYLKP